MIICFINIIRINRKKYTRVDWNRGLFCIPWKLLFRSTFVLSIYSEKNVFRLGQPEEA